MQSNKLHTLHSTLTDRYTELLAGGTEDPRLLKEIREFLNDNNINDISLNSIVPEGSNESVDLDDDYMAGYQLAK